VRRFVLICVAMVVMALTTASAAGAAGWTIQPTPNPTVPQGALSAVSCTSAAACTAVGYAPDVAGPIVPLAERWDGTAWMIQSTPNVAGTTAGALEGVACISMTTCIAVGHYVDSAGTTVTLAEAWDGSDWTIKATPNPAGATGSFLSGVSCSSAKACTALGDYIVGAGTGAELTLAERWNGSNWTIQTTPNPTGSDFMFRGVSCPTASACTAVGQYTAPGGAAAALAEVWDGTSWTTQPTPNTPGANDSLDSVSCTSPSACTAVGDSAGFFGPQTALAERWDGTSWTVQSTPNPADSSFVYLRGVSCSTASACSAVGFYTNSAGSQVTLAEVWDGTGWTIQSTPNPAGPSFVGLLGVSCSASSACNAVGLTEMGPTLTLAEHWDGSSWTIQSTPNPAGAVTTNLVGVSCSSASQCVSVGFSPVPGTPLAESWDGSSWTLQSVPSPADADSSILSRVSCASPMACVAVGFYLDSAGARHTLAEGWNGSSWSLQPTPEPVGAKGSFLDGVSCTSPTACVAVGSYVNSAGTTVTLIDGWDGTSWSLQQSPNPAGATDSELNGVSCPTAAACTAVGFYSNGPGTDLPLAEARSGGGWVIQAVPLPAAAGNVARFTTVSCSAATACTALGFLGSQGPLPAGFAERWDGSTWTVQPIARPATADEVVLFGITCAASTDCIAVGSYIDSTSHAELTLAEAWDGGSWTVQPSPNPPGAHGSALNAVSCPTTTVCTAVGWSFSGGPNGGDTPSAALAERYTAPVPTSLTAAPQLVIFPPPFGVGLGTVSATLTSRGSALGGRPVAFNVGGLPLCSAVTDANGTATCHVGFFAELIVLFAGSYSATFTGDASFRPSSASVPWIALGSGVFAAARVGPHRHVSIVQGTITRSRVLYAVLVRRTNHGVTSLGFKALRRIRPGRYTLTLKLTGGIQVHRTIALR
jgi:hypothetical protein